MVYSLGYTRQERDNTVKVALQLSNRRNTKIHYLCSSETGEFCDFLVSFRTLFPACCLEGIVPLSAL